MMRGLRDFVSHSVGVAYRSPANTLNATTKMFLIILVEKEYRVK